MVRFLLSTKLFSCAPKPLCLAFRIRSSSLWGVEYRGFRGSGGNSSVIHYPFAKVRQSAISYAFLNLWVHLSAPIDRAPFSMRAVRLLDHSVSVCSFPRLVSCGLLQCNPPTTVPPLNEHPNHWYHSQSMRPSLRQTRPRWRRLVAEATRKTPVSFVMRTWMRPLKLLL